jgi:hypothetical protein
MHLRSGIIWFFGSSHGENLDRGYALRFQLSTIRKMVIWVLIFIQLAMAFGSGLVMLLQCRPIRAFWEHVPDGVCWSSRSSHIYGYTATG